ncbi:MAG: sulfite exporter TauE/SafE family protein [Gammaproteobacteria bacterium]|nr:sulfite exporter TauE/SafE family protein [Gammaproteobacteria bacterium]MDH3448810.1 sulfite exporter TauE/SafE family protein [Gammaproteobacteria bacterium]
MTDDLTFGAAIIVGLLGSSHCIGMCGGIVAALNMGIADGISRKPGSLFVFQLGYNAGRITSYLLVGLLAGSLGAGLAQLGVSPVVGKLFAASFLIALGLYLANWWRGLALLERLGFIVWRHIQPLGKRLFPIRNPAQAYLLGLIWGWLPCGLVYAVVAWSLTTANALEGAKLMLGFGLGTLPGLLIAGNVLNHFKNRVRSPLLRTSAGIIIIAFGLYSGFTGLTGHYHHRVTDLSSTTLPSLAGFELIRIPPIFCSVS